jgi:hypothetical protein
MPQQLYFNCRFWDRREKKWYCRRYAPHALIMVTGQPATPATSIYWPITTENDWCGEYKEVK